MKKKADKYTAKELVFCYEYVANKFNGTKAYLASYSTKNENTAKVEASKLLTKPNIKKKIRELTKKYLLKAEHQAEDIIRELALLGFSDLSDFVEWKEDGTIKLKSSDSIGERIAALREIEIEDIEIGGTKVGKKYKIKLHDKKGSLELLGKHAELFTEKHKITGDIIHIVSEEYKHKDGARNKS